MTLSAAVVRHYLKEFELEKLFIEELGWDRHAGALEVPIDGQIYTLSSFAEKRGAQVFQCQPDGEGKIPEYATRRKIERQVTKSAYEHVIIFVDGGRSKQVWQWVAREPDQPVRYRELHFTPGQQTGEVIYQKLQAIEFPFSDEESIDLFEVTRRLKDAVPRDTVTKKFYDQFKREHAAFLKFIKGITELADKEWYASLMLNRLMFVYFIQKKGFLDGNTKYLQDRLEKVQSRKGKDKFHSFYNYFLLCLFHQGFSRQPEHRELDDDLKDLLGDVPYLNGGLFDVHELEEKHPKIDIPDEAFEKLFAFFDQYEWHLDTRPLQNDKEINPDVLGYIFEKYINQKQMGAYYTKEDITDYISKNTIIPYLCDAAEKKCAVAFEPGSAVWRLLADDPDRYLYPAVRHGVIDEYGEMIPLPEQIAAGVKDVGKRDGWNRAAEPPYALPTETWREHVARRERCLEVREKLQEGKIHQINDLITFNLNIRQFAEDVIVGCEGPELLRAFWQAIRKVTVLDPTCGSGAFLFAALNILEPLYAACLDRMQAFADDLERSGERHDPRKFSDFRKVLAETNKHPNVAHFILKSIIVGNLYGVDIMEEAVEICKLRLFLKLVAQVDKVKNLEPLPDIDFNIRPGNTLVGFATLKDVKGTILGKLADDELKAEVKRIVEEAEIVDKAYRKFQEMQTNFAMDARAFADAKRSLRERLNKLAAELNRYLAGEYGVKSDKPKEFDKWRSSHQPFHWFAEFFGIMRSGGFDVVIGNPPYVEYSKIRKTYTVRDYFTLSCGNLYTFVLERCKHLVASRGRLGLIVPLSVLCTDRMGPARRLLEQRDAWLSAFDMRPSSLFEGVAQRLCILLQGRTVPKTSRSLFTGGYRRWSPEERPTLLAQTRLVRSDWSAKDAPIFKASSELELRIRKKISGPSLEQISDERAKPIYVHRICRYFVKALDFVPHFRSATGEKGKSEDYKPFRFEASQRGTVLSLLNSSLFYWHWRGLGDGFHCGYGDVYRMPYAATFEADTSEALGNVAAELLDSLKESSRRKAIKTKRGEIEYQEFYPASCKPIIDEIDVALARHYRFSPDELDFVINYDAKYRVGLDDSEDDE